jgi:plasmid maintenance system killer protein
MMPCYTAQELARHPQGSGRLKHHAVLSLKGNLAGSYSIRVNDQWRIVFAFENGQASGVQIADYH